MDANSMSTIFGLIEEDELIRTTIALVRFASENPPGQEAAVAEWILNYLQAIGVEASLEQVSPGRPNVRAVLRGKQRGGVLFEGHLDVVPAGQGWCMDPFGANIVDDRIYGRGACDMKGGIAAMIHAIRAIKKSGLIPENDVHLLFVVDEELTSTGVKKAISSGIEASCAVVGEPSELQINTAQKGVAAFRVVCNGKAAHASVPDKGVNAIYLACEAITALRNHHTELQKRVHPLVGHATLSIGTISGGTKRNIVPSACEFTIDRRNIPGESFATVREEIAGVLARSLDPLNARYSLEDIVYTGPAEVSAGEPVVTALSQAVAQSTGIPAEITSFPATCDIYHLQEFAGIPAIVFGPGSISNAHTADEYVKIAELVVAAKSYALLPFLIGGTCRPSSG